MYKSDVMCGFETGISAIFERLNQIDPVNYGKTRNYIDGGVSRLSPYISRGILSTRQVLQSLLDRRIPPASMEKFIQELAWREYWQRIWVEKRDRMDIDTPFEQSPVRASGIPVAIQEANTGIQGIDQAVRQLYQTGYMHNHARMYVAMAICNVAQCHWLLPAKWMYYHLLDADWASNALSWQWVAGAYIGRKYFANQENINKFCRTDQHDTFLDKGYPELAMGGVPDILKPTGIPNFPVSLPPTHFHRPPAGRPACVYTIYNLDPDWRKDMDATRVLLLEPSQFQRFPMKEITINFICALAANIPGIQTYTGEFDEWVKDHAPSQVFFKEHPTNRHFRGTRDERDWAFHAAGHYRSFSSFWRQASQSIAWR